MKNLIIGSAIGLGFFPMVYVFCFYLVVLEEWLG